MTVVGHDNWSRATVSEVERGGRTVTVDELLALAMVLGVTIGDLLDPAGVDGRATEDLDFTPDLPPHPVEEARAWVRSKALYTLEHVEGDDWRVDIRPAPDVDVSYNWGSVAMLQRLADRHPDVTTRSQFGDEGETS